MRKSITFLIFLYITFIYPQGNNKILFESDFKNANILRTENYKGKSLYGYIDGGADLYYEYNFEDLIFYEIKIDGKIVRFEFYSFNDELDAFGIFSVINNGKYYINKKGFYFNFDSYHINSCFGKYFISISSDEKIKEDIFKEYLNTAIQKIKYKKLKLPFKLKNYNRLNDLSVSIIFIKGKLGIQNSISDYEESFEDFDKIAMFYFHNKITNKDYFLISKEDIIRADFIKKIKSKFKSDFTLKQVNQKYFLFSTIRIKESELDIILK